MVCSNCGTANEAGRKFCKECAGPLAVGCPVCGSGNPADAKFCGECAAPLTTVTPAVTARAPIAERRLVSVLFIDLVGFTPFAEGRDAEEVRDALSRYFDIARGIIERYGGTVEKFIGDAVMAVWGSPLAHEDDAERAVRAALELVDGVGAVGPGISARAGVLTGEAAVTIGATNQGMVAGDLVNTAARLQSAAPAGAVLVGESTQRATSRAIAYEPAGEQELKGKASPVPAWRALRVVAEVGGKNRAGTLEAPFVGRDDELRMLKDLFHATGREGRVRLVSISAPAGLGKSRLAWELSKYVDGLVEPIWWHAGRSPAYGEGITFWALGEMVRQRAGLAETDDEATTRALIAATVREWITDAGEQRWVEPALLALLGVEPVPGGPEQLFGAWRTFFERITAQGTVALVFEDLHWADPGTLDFIDHLIEWSRGVPLFVMTLARPELFERRPGWTSGRRSFTSIVLDPLADPAMAALLEGLVPGLPEPTVQRIVTRAEGVPLYAVETVRMLVADGKLVRSGDDGAYGPTADLSELAVPETLTALIAARLDALEPAERGLVSDAAVLGQSFTLAGLAAVTGTTEMELEPRLRTLVRREILAQALDPRSPERGQYGFVQALIREVAYNTLARRDRRARHLAAARFFETLDTDELSGAVAGHLLAAFALSTPGPEADAVGVQARIALRAAANRAASLGAHEQAVVFLRQALTVTTDPVEEAELLERAGDSASAALHHDEAETLLRRAVALHHGRDDRPATARAVAALGRVLIEAFRMEQALAVLGPAADEFADLGTDAGFIALLGQLARAYMLHEEPARAVEVADRTLVAAERADLVGLVADTLVTKGTALGYLARRYEGQGAIEAGLHLAEQHGLAVTALRARTNLGLLLERDDPRTAVENDRIGLDEARRLGQRAYALTFLTNAAEGALWAGDWDWALSELDELLTSELEREDRITVLVPVLSVRDWRGEAADELFAEIERLAVDTADPNIASNVAGARANRAFARGDFETAAAEFRRMALMAASAYRALATAARASLLVRDAGSAAGDLAALEATGAHARRIDACRTSIQAGLAALEGRSADALSLYRDALRRFRDLGQPVDEAFTAIEMASLLDPAEPEVRAAADSAREILSRLRAQPFLERLDTAMARPSPVIGKVGSDAMARTPAQATQARP